MDLKISRYRWVFQTSFFASFIILLVIASKQIQLPFSLTQLWLETDPLVAIIALIAGLPMAAGLAYSLLTVIVTLLFGRVFCGYACPMGALVDVFSPLAYIFKINQKVFRRLRWLPIIMLAAFILLSAFHSGILSILDPISLITRSSMVAIGFGKALIGLVTKRLQPTPLFGDYSGTDEGLMMNVPRIFDSSGFIILLLMFILTLNLLGKKFWCRYLCPLGGLLGLLSLSPIYRRKVDAKACNSCLKCDRNCDMDAVRDRGLATDTGNCTMCLTCRDVCPQNAISKGLKTELSVEIPSRRTALAVIGGSIAVAAFSPYKAQANTIDSTLIRPPGVFSEEDFISTCIRCGECMTACPTKVLQPALLQYGIGALWTPHLDFTAGTCEFMCKECTKVCPTGAIKKLTLDEKQSFIIGTAKLYEDKCIRYIRGRGCGICVEVCPLRGKALYMAGTGISGYGYGQMRSMPYINDQQCIGCGICEAVCPVRDDKAIKVLSPAKAGAITNDSGRSSTTDSI